MRFEIQQEMDDEPVVIGDCATDPDSENFEVVRISSRYGTPRSRGQLARRIKAVLEEMAGSGEETR